jgi:hypothetical protein
MGLFGSSSDRRYQEALGMIDYIAHQQNTLPPPGDPVANLIHTVAAQPQHRNDEMAILATEGIYSDHRAEGIHLRPGGGALQTGLTWGDLRAIAAWIEENSQ